MPFECFVTKATNTHSGCVVFIDFPWQWWFHICISTLHLYVHCVSLSLSAPPACYIPNSVDMHKSGWVTGGMEKFLNRINNFHFSPKILWLFCQELQACNIWIHKRCVLCYVVCCYVVCYVVCFKVTLNSRCSKYKDNIVLVLRDSGIIITESTSVIYMKCCCVLWQVLGNYLQVTTCLVIALSSFSVCVCVFFYYQCLSNFPADNTSHGIRLGEWAHHKGQRVTWYLCHVKWQLNYWLYRQLRCHAWRTRVRSSYHINF
jgi:hypothetical protein